MVIGLQRKKKNNIVFNLFAFYRGVFFVLKTSENNGNHFTLFLKIDNKK